jgi:hypothetical protein
MVVFDLVDHLAPVSTGTLQQILCCLSLNREILMKQLFMIVAVAALATPALADDVGVRVGPVGAGVSVGEGHRDYDRDRDHTTVIKEREPTDRTTVIKKENEDGTRSKTVIHDRD